MGERGQLINELLSLLETILQNGLSTPGEDWLGRLLIGKRNVM